MSFCELHWFSGILNRQTTTWVLLPDAGAGPFATFYLLHGLSDDHTAWLRRTRIESYISGLSLIVVMPDGGRGFYTDHDNGPRWATHMAEELPAMIERTFPAKQDRRGRCVGGLSMGGYGALRLALGYPDRYISANSHSGALLGPSPTRFPQAEFQLMIGSAYEDSDHDLLALARRSKQKNLLPQLLIDCGTEDFLIKDNREFHQSLQRLKIDHKYSEFPGMHNWDYWDQHVRDALAFHMEAIA